MKLSNITIGPFNDFNHSFDDQNWQIFGESQTGKTLILKLIAKHIKPKDGIVVNDKKTVILDKEVGFGNKTKASYLYYQQRFNSQDAEISPSLYEVLQGISKPMGTIHTASVDIPKNAYNDEELESICKKLDIDHLLKRNITSLSNGETKRALLAFLLLKKPELLLLDDPLIGLDADSRARFKKLINEALNVQTIVAANELFQGISHKIELKNTKSSERLPNFILPKPTFIDFEFAFKLKDVSIHYENPVLNKLNWVVRKNEKWALSGPNGSGKSTLLSLLTADHPQRYANNIELFDRKTLNMWEIKKQIGFVSPELQLYFNRNTCVWKVLASGFFDTAGLFKKLDAGQYATVENFLNMFGLTPFKDHALHQLSDAFKRMLFIARALIKNPPLLLLDEPCQGLDSQKVDFIKTLIDNIVKQNYITLIYVTHVAEEIPSCIDKYARMVNGTIEIS